jgi:hypothetical protein
MTRTGGDVIGSALFVTPAMLTQAGTFRTRFARTITSRVVPTVNVSP